MFGRGGGWNFRKNDHLINERSLRLKLIKYKTRPSAYGQGDDNLVKIN